MTIEALEKEEKINAVVDKECEFCKDLEDETNVEITEIKIRSVGYYGWNCPVNYCPACGKRKGVY